jgi:hypothetical protein
MLIFLINESYLREIIMKTITRILLALSAIGTLCLASTASAIPVIGVTVDDFTTPASVGSTENRSALGGDAIKYYIPLGNTDCTYGIGTCGTQSDSGNGGGILSMNLMFTPVDMVASSLSVLFEDLDLTDANDPYGFFESVQVFDGAGIALTTKITDISSSLVSGNKDTQQLLSLDLGILTSDTYFATLKFDATYYRRGRNTAEYLIASIDHKTVPEPATVSLLALGLIGIGAIRHRRTRK